MNWFPFTYTLDNLITNSIHAWLTKDYRSSGMSLANDDIMSDGDDDDKINSPKFDNRTPKSVNHGKICNGDAKLIPWNLHVLFLSD